MYILCCVNDKGQQLVDFAANRNMTIISELFPGKEMHKQTWVSPHGMTSHEIDHILIERRWATCIMNITSYRVTCCASDHFLVKATLRWHIMVFRTGGIWRALQCYIYKLQGKEFHHQFSFSIIATPKG